MTTTKPTPLSQRWVMGARQTGKAHFMFYNIGNMLDQEDTGVVLLAKNEADVERLTKGLCKYLAVTSLPENCIVTTLKPLPEFNAEYYHKRLFVHQNVTGYPDFNKLYNERYEELGVEFDDMTVGITKVLLNSNDLRAYFTVGFEQLRAIIAFTELRGKIFRSVIAPAKE